MAPRFEPDCAKPAKRSWTSRGLAFESVRDNGSCAEFLVHDPKKSDRGFLHVWYGPDAKEHPRLAEGLVESIRPAPPGSESSESPACP
jgi:hypothetical protein